MILQLRYYISNLFAGELSLRGSADATVGPGATTDDTLMDSGLNAVVHLEVKLGELVLLVGRGILDITEGRGINDVADDEALDGLVLGAALGAVEAANSVGVTLVALVPSVVSSFDWHNLIIINSQDTPF